MPPPAPSTAGLVIAFVLSLLLGALFVEVERQQQSDMRLFSHYGKPISVSSANVYGIPSTIVMTESRIGPKSHPIQEWWHTAQRVLRQPFSRPEDR